MSIWIQQCQLLAVKEWKSIPYLGISTIHSGNILLDLPRACNLQSTNSTMMLPLPLQRAAMHSILPNNINIIILAHLVIVGVFRIGHAAQAFEPTIPSRPSRIVVENVSQKCTC